MFFCYPKYPPKRNWSYQIKLAQIFLWLSKISSETLLPKKLQYFSCFPILPQHGADSRTGYNLPGYTVTTFAHHHLHICKIMIHSMWCISDVYDMYEIVYDDAIFDDQLWIELARIYYDCLCTHWWI